MRRIVVNLSGIQSSLQNELDAAMHYLTRNGTQYTDIGRAVETTLKSIKEIHKAIDEIKQALREIVAHLETN
jgi:TPP-dependent 2-oxoacid decarboxylase